MTRNSYPSSADPVEVKMIGTVRWVRGDRARRSAVPVTGDPSVPGADLGARFGR